STLLLFSKVLPHQQVPPRHQQEQHQPAQPRHQKEQQQQQQGETLIESMNYTIDPEGAIVEDDDDVHQSSSTTPNNRNSVRANSHSPGTVTLNPNDISSLSSPTSTSSP
ncbi:unnamed protein product, partial [Didymodactylos carnosus]